MVTRGYFLRQELYCYYSGMWTSSVMHECKYLTLTEHRHNVGLKNLINVTSRVKIPVTNNKGRFESRVHTLATHIMSPPSPYGLTSRIQFCA